MKTNKFLLVFAVAVLTYSSCGDEVDDVLDAQDEQTTSQESVFTYDMVFDCDITSYDGTTRATTASAWENGDIVYLYFGGNNNAYGQAEYISSSKKWRVTCDKALAEATNNTCYVSFGKGVNPKERNNNNYNYIYYTYMSEAYRTTNGKYTYANNGIYINASLQPQGWRLRFKGAAGTQLRISGTNIYYYLWKNNYGSFYNSLGDIELTVKSDGYTDYYIGSTGSSTTSISLINYTTGEVYTRYFDDNTLKSGESGYFTIPTSSNMRGWTRTTSNFKQYVDLGLPSGTKWATCNIGASSPEEYGGSYAWGETTQKQYGGDWFAYDYCNGTNESCYYIGDDIAGTEYDVAHTKWGGSWRMPNHDQWYELWLQCTSSTSTQNGVQGYLFTGPNGRTIFMTDNNYWTSSLYSSYNAYYSSPGYWDSGYRYYQMRVRAVCP